MLLQWKMCQKASSRILKKTERTVSVHDQPKVWSRGRGFSKSKIVFQQRTSQISLVLATISSLEDRGSSIPFQGLIQFTSGSKLCPSFLHIKIDLKIKLDMENIAK
jgi:hypothetical protein